MFVCVYTRIQQIVYIYIYIYIYRERERERESPSFACIQEGRQNTYFIHKLLEGFHQRCLRQILHIKWQSHVSDTEVFGKAGLPSIQSMVMKSCLRWVGHNVRMNEGRLPKQLFSGEMWEGKRSALKPKKRLKDTIKYYLKQSGLSVEQWEKWLQIEVSGGNWFKKA